MQQFQLLLKPHSAARLTSAHPQFVVPIVGFVVVSVNEVGIWHCGATCPHDFIPTDRVILQDTINPMSYSQSPVKPARRKPATTDGQRRMRLQINPVR